MVEPLAQRIKHFLGSLLETKETRTLKSSVYWALGQYQYTPEDYEDYAKEAYCGNADVFAAVYAIQCAVGGIPWKLYGLNAQGEKDKEIDKHELVNLIKRPNPYQGWSQFLAEGVGYLMLSGNWYIERVGPDEKGVQPPRELFNLRPDRMIVHAGTTEKRVDGYRYGPDVELAAEVILHLKRFNPVDDWYGMSPIMPLIAAINQNNAADAWNFAIFKNMGRPSGFLQIDEEVDENEFKILKKRVTEEFAGTDNAAKIGLLTGGMQWTQGSLAPKDMDFLQMYRKNSRQIFSGFGVPAQLVGDEESKTYANYAEARTAFYQETILPLLDWVKAELNNWLVPLFGGNILLDYDKEEVEALQEDRTAVISREVQKLTSGAATLNEVREALDEDDLGPDGDVLFIDQRLIPTKVSELAPEPEEIPSAQSEGQPTGEATQEQPVKPQPIRESEGGANEVPQV